MHTLYMWLTILGASFSLSSTKYPHLYVNSAFFSCLDWSCGPSSLPLFLVLYFRTKTVALSTICISWMQLYVCLHYTCDLWSKEDVFNFLNSVSAFVCHLILCVFCMSQVAIILFDSHTFVPMVFCYIFLVYIALRALPLLCV